MAWRRFSLPDRSAAASARHSSCSSVRPSGVSRCAFDGPVGGNPRRSWTRWNDSWARITWRPYESSGSGQTTIVQCLPFQSTAVLAIPISFGRIVEGTGSLPTTARVPRSTKSVGPQRPTPHRWPASRSHMARSSENALCAAALSMAACARGATSRRSDSRIRFMSSDLSLALALADEADAITIRFFRTSFAVRTKADRTPVTEVDEGVERMVRARLERERPGDAIVGEEFGSQGKPGGRRWIVDPIDATKNFLRGIPVFATLIALENEVGVVSAPSLGQRWWTSRGEGAFCNGTPIHVSTIETLAESHLCYDDVPGFQRYALGERFLALARRGWRSRGFGDFGSHMLVAEGAVAIAAAPESALWDPPATQVHVKEARRPP